MGLGALLAPPAAGRSAARRAAADAPRAGSLGRALSGQAQRALHPRPADHRREALDQLQQFLRIRHDKDIADDAQALPIRPWTVAIDGMVEKPMTIAIDDLLKQDAARGAALSPSLRRGLVDGGAVDRLSAEGAGRSRQAAGQRRNTCRSRPSRTPRSRPGQKQFWYPWPYIEGLTMAEATNELAFIVTGMYGKPVPRAERRAAAPGAAVEIRLQIGQVDRQVHLHRQAAEVLLGGAAGERVRLLGQRQSGRAASALEPGDRAGRSAPTSAVPTLIWNGYGEYVAAHL